MEKHPVELSIPPFGRPMAPIHVVVRLALLCALGALGWSSLYWAIYLALPAVACLLVLQGGSEPYPQRSAANIAEALRWLAGLYAYLWLLTDELPSADRSTAELTIAPSGTPTPASAILRLLTTLPALLLLVIASAISGLLWPVGALFVLLGKRLPDALRTLFTATLRYQFRLVAYHLSLVDRYPAFESATAQPAAPSAPLAV